MLRANDQPLSLWPQFLKRRRVLELVCTNPTLKGSWPLASPLMLPIISPVPVLFDAIIGARYALSLF